MRAVASALALASVLVALPAQAAEWQIDTAHSVVGFSVRHLMVSNAKGEFGTFTGTINLDDKDVTKSSVVVEIDTASVDTRNKDRDDHLRNADFFDSAKHPKMTFKSTKVEKSKEGKLMVTGDLTIKGVTKPVTLVVDGPSQAIEHPFTKKPTVGFTAMGKINRSDYGLKWNKALEKGGVAVGDEVTILIEIEAQKADAAK